MPKVKQRKLSYGEELENLRKKQGQLGRQTNTYTYSIKTGNLSYAIYQGIKRDTKKKPANLI